MSAIVPFQFGDQPVRITDRDGQPWFSLADICRVLEISNVGNAAARLDDDEKDVIPLTDSIGREQDATVVNESGMYRLVVRSRKESARRFTKWVTSVVLPSIRKTGGFGAPVEAALPRDPRALLAYLAQQAGDMVGLQDALDALAPKADALDRLSDAQGSLCITDAAKALAVPPRRLFAWLEAKSWIYRRSEGGQWVAFEAKRQSGVVEHKGTRIEVRGRPAKWVEQVMVTPKGLARLAELKAGA